MKTAKYLVEYHVHGDSINTKEPFPSWLSMRLFRISVFFCPGITHIKTKKF